MALLLLLCWGVGVRVLFKWLLLLVDGSFTCKIHRLGAGDVEVPRDVYILILFWWNLSIKKKKFISIKQYFLSLQKVSTRNVRAEKYSSTCMASGGSSNAEEKGRSGSIAGHQGEPSALFFSAQSQVLQCTDMGFLCGCVAGEITNK
mmetsp:Transcript_18943/g.38078  ORF Transcript_18943/g.38078 Transcript_18943/m.38078 type:complete len:147 (+) Transcript_18943:2477-2917(+)